MTRSIVIVMAVLAVGLAMAEAETYVVRPDGTGDFPTIQAAIDAAVDGDVIELTDGTFTGEGNGHLSFLGKPITVRSQGGDPELCTISGHTDGGSMVRFAHGETEQTVLEGVTVAGGHSGIVCNYASSPSIRNCVVRNGWAYFGGGIACYAGSSPIIDGCVIRNNGAGIGQYPGWGGGLSVLDESHPTLVDCVVQDNQAGGVGGGIYCSGASLTLVDCTVVGSRASGLYCSSSDVAVTRCVISGSYYMAGAGISCRESDITISESTIAGNRGFERAGGIELIWDSSALIDRTVFWGNCADEGHEIHVDGSSSAEFVCSIVDSAGVWAEGEIVGLGPESFLDPLFCDPAACEDAPTAEGDYTVDASSPCTAENSPCGEQIGALPVGCESAPVKSTTWGAIKAMFRE